jgi:hypothetical protein
MSYQAIKKCKIATKADGKFYVKVQVESTNLEIHEYEDIYIRKNGDGYKVDFSECTMDGQRWYKSAGDESPETLYPSWLEEEIIREFKRRFKTKI